MLWKCYGSFQLHTKLCLCFQKQHDVKISYDKLPLAQFPFSFKTKIACHFKFQYPYSKNLSLLKCLKALIMKQCFVKSWLNWNILLKGVITKTRRFAHKLFPGVKFNKASCSLSASTRNFRFH